MEDILEFGSKMREPPFANSNTFTYKMTDDVKMKHFLF